MVTGLLHLAHTLLSYLKSPIVELIVGSGDAQTVLSAHQALLVKAPYFAERSEKFKPKGLVCTKPLVFICSLTHF
jgi:hypothetical protein